MTDQTEHVVRWEPLPDLPQLPLSNVNGQFEGESLRVIADFAFCKELSGIEIEFGTVEAFELSEEFSDRMLTINCSLPRLANANLPAYTWPFLEVKNSKWVVEIAQRNAALDQSEWRHLVVLSLDRTLHVMMHGDLISARMRHGEARPQTIKLPSMAGSCTGRNAG